jgi:hypothetical protein
MSANLISSYITLVVQVYVKDTTTLCNLKTKYNKAVRYICSLANAVGLNIDLK